MQNEVLITGAQLRGARGMLMLSSDCLARRARVHRRSIRAIEGCDVVPQRETLARSIRALEMEGIDFLTGGGVALRSEHARPG